MNQNNQIVIAVVVTAIVFGGGGYFFGKQGTKAQAPQTFTRGTQGGVGQNASGRTARPGGMAGGGMTSGEVLSKDGTSLTLKLRDGGSRIVIYAPSTNILRTASGTIEDISIGAQISVIGTQNPDGSMVATSLQVRPEDATGMPPR
jgi:hypothetical protein